MTEQLPPPTHRVLVVDDEPDLEALISQRFRKRIRSGEMSFLFASHGQDALDKLGSAGHVDVVLSDINMPVMDGLTLLGRLKESYPLVRSVIVSAYGDMPNIRGALNRGAFDFVTKPIDFTDLEITLNRAIEESIARREAAEARERLLHLNKELITREAEKQALSKYLPPQVAQLLLEDSQSDRLQGVEQFAAILFADIRGFTTLAERLEAREVVSLLNEFFTDMSAVIIEQRGTLDKFIGDCIMALFGAPQESSNPAAEAVQAAIQMQSAMAELNLSRLARNLPQFEVGIGIHVGQAVVGNIGSADRVQYTAIGDTVNVAARLVGKAAPGQILVSDAVQAALPNGAYQFTGLGELDLKGRTARLPVFSVEAKSAAVSS